jgi:amino acid transporter
MIAREAPKVEFLKSLGVRDVALMVVIAVVSLRWIPRAARAGWPSMSLWCLAGLCFFVPLAAVAVELSARYPEQGGTYVWAREAFGPRHAFFCGWCLWLNEVFYFPSYLLFALANLLALGGGSTAGLAKNRIFCTAIVLVLLWGLTALNVLGLQVTKWFQNLGTLGIWVPVGLLFVAVVMVISRTGPAQTPHLADILPQSGSLGALGLWSSMCFAFSGMEIAGMVGQEVGNPRRTIPLGLGLGGAAIVLVYLAGSAAILTLIPAAQISERTGISDAIQLATHSGQLANLVSALIAIAAVATTSSWIAGSGRLPYAAAAEGQLPAYLARVHPRFRTPHTALITQAAVASGALVVSMFLNVQNQSTTVEEAYDVLVNLTILIYFIPYLYMFLVPLRLKAPAADSRLPVIPFGWSGRVLVSTLGTLTTLISIILLFVPPPGTHSVWNFESNLILQSGLIFAAGLLMDRFRNRSRS